MHSIPTGDEHSGVARREAKIPSQAMGHADSPILPEVKLVS